MKAFPVVALLPGFLPSIFATAFAQPTESTQRPSLEANDQARVRMTVTAEGYGAIEFLDAAGKVVHVLAPERELKK